MSGNGKVTRLSGKLTTTLLWFAQQLSRAVNVMGGSYGSQVFVSNIVGLSYTLCYSQILESCRLSV